MKWPRALLSLPFLLLALPAATDPVPDAGTRIRAEAHKGQAFTVLQHLTDRIGPRLSGSAGAAEAVRWTAGWLRGQGLAVKEEPVTVPHWERGEETAEIVAPVRQRLAITALGGSDPTPAGGITAEVVAVRDIDALNALPPDAVRGRIVLFTRPMKAASGFDGYGEVSPNRTRGASAAARLGAVGSLVRSLGTASFRLPHTGTVTWAKDAPRIPAASVSAEDAELIGRFLDAGERVRLTMRLGCRNVGETPSANVVADLVGREKPEEIVLISAHLDSWDLATGAVDDGAGVAMVMESLRVLKTLGLTPRRTVRGVLYMNEENGLRGGKAYRAAHEKDAHLHVAAVESDSGAGAPIALNTSVPESALSGLADLAAALQPLNIPLVAADNTGADITPLRRAGVPTFGLKQENSRYFDWHHSAADTLDKVVPAELDQNVAALALLAYTLAERPGAAPHTAPSPEPPPE